MVKNGDRLSIVITEEVSEPHWNVWVSLPDHDPVNDPFGFVIGVGSTRDVAVEDAVAVLEDCCDRLQAQRDPVNGIEERKVDLDG